LEYEYGDQISQELINLLHRLRLIYTHRSGVEPPNSLRSLNNFKDGEIAELSPTDREKVLQFLLDHANLNEDEQAEILEYAHRTDANVSEQEVSEEQQATSSSTNGDLSLANSLDTQQKGENASASVSTDNDHLSELELECDYCDEIISGTEYVEHVRQSGNHHDDVGSLPERFLSEPTPIVETAAADIMYPDDLECDFEYYPVCRQCGKRFTLLGSYQVHKNSNRRNVDKNLHSENVEQYTQPLVLPFTSNLQIPIAESQLAEEVTEVALSKLDFVSNKPNNKDTFKQTRDVSNEISEKDTTSVSGQDVSDRNDERITEYECAWVLTDLTRFLTVLGQYYTNKEVQERISNHYDGVMEHARGYYNKTKELPGSLREYQTQWEHPEVGVRVPRKMLKHIDVGDYRGEIFLPPGYCYPVAEIDQWLEVAWLEQTYSDKRQTISTINGKDNEDAPSSATGSIADSAEENTIKPDEGEIDVNSSIPPSVLREIISKYRRHEEDGRQASWFHAAEILRQTVEEKTGFEIQDETRTDER
jgi:hypothetical protein